MALLLSRDRSRRRAGRSVRGGRSGGNAGPARAPRRTGRSARGDRSARRVDRSARAGRPARISRLLLPLALLALASGATALPAQETPAGDTATVEPAALVGPGALGRSLDAALDDPALARAHVGISVRAAGSGEVLYERSGHRRFTTASTAKLLTAAAALERLGPGFRWATGLAACGPAEEGTLRGDLVITGAGDPTIGPGRLSAWADSLRAAGIRRIAGDVVADDRAFPPPIWGRGWMWDDLHLGWASGVDALQLADPALEVVLRPGRRLGDTVRLRVRDTLRAPDAVDRTPVDVRVRTGPRGSELRLRHLPGASPGGRGRIVGWMPADRDSLVLSLAPRHPTDRLLDALAGTFAASGPEVEGSFRRRGDDPSAAGPPRADRTPRPAPRTDGTAARGRDEAGGAPGPERNADRPPAGPCRAADGPAGRRIVSRSDSLGAVLAEMLGRSDNQAAESILRTLGLEEGRAGTAAEGSAVVSETLAGWGVPPGAVSLADGAGLSRYDQATPAALTRVLRATWLGPHRNVFLDALAAPGRAGTLHGRFRGVPARRTLRAKTGSLSSVRALAGYVEAADGRTLAFALMLGGYHVPGDVAEALRDRVVERLALYRAEAEDPAAEEPAEEEPGEEPEARQPGEEPDVRQTPEEP